MNQYIVTDEQGAPAAFVNVDQIQAQATRLAYDMAVACGDPGRLTEITTAHLTEAGHEAFGYVAAAALRTLAEHVLDPVLEVTDELHRAGYLSHDLRSGLEDAAANATTTLTHEEAI